MTERTTNLSALVKQNGWQETVGIDGKWVPSPKPSKSKPAP